MAISKVKTVEAKGEWSNEHGTMYTFLYTFEDGTAITANHKTKESPFHIGAEAEYEVKKESEQHGKSGSVKKVSDFQPGGGGEDYNAKQLMIVKQNVLGHATKLLEHNAIMDNKKFVSDTVIALAEKYKNWVMKPDKVAPEQPKTKAPEAPAPTPDPLADQEKLVDRLDDGLPF